MMANPQPAWAPIVHPPIINNAATLPLPGEFIEGRTGRNVGLYGVAISSGSNRVGDDEHPDRQLEFTADNNQVFSRLLEPIFMRYLTINLSLCTQYVERIPANTEKSRGLATKIAALYSRLKAECFCSNDMKNYIWRCILDIERRRNRTGNAYYDMSTAEFARVLGEYFIKETFYTLWYPHRHSVNLVEIYGVANPTNVLLKRYSRTIFTIIAWTTVHKTPRALYPLTDDEIKPDLPSEAIYVDVLEAVRSYPNLPAPPDIPTPGEVWERTISKSRGVLDYGAGAGFFLEDNGFADD